MISDARTRPEPLDENAFKSVTTLMWPLIRWQSLITNDLASGVHVRFYNRFR